MLPALRSENHASLLDEVRGSVKEADSLRSLACTRAVHAPTLAVPMATSVDFAHFPLIVLFAGE